MKNLLSPHAHRVYSLGRQSSLTIDVTDFNSIESTFKKIILNENRIDYLINSSGDLILKSIEDTTVQEWEHILDTNLKGCFLVSKAILPYLKKQQAGNIMFLGSSSYTRGRAGYAAYSSSKAALVNFCQAFAEEVSSYNIKVNIASPSRVQTPLRYRNFGKEDPVSLLDAGLVAKQIALAMLSDTTGSVFEIV